MLHKTTANLDRTTQLHHAGDPQYQHKVTVADLQSAEQQRPSCLLHLRRTMITSCHEYITTLADRLHLVFTEQEAPHCLPQLMSTAIA